jgi:hypothetical protein
VDRGALSLKAASLGAVVKPSAFIEDVVMTEENRSYNRSREFFV